MSITEPRRLVLRNELPKLERLAPWIERRAPGWRVVRRVRFAVRFASGRVVANVICTARPRGARLRFQSTGAVAGMLVARI